MVPALSPTYGQTNTPTLLLPEIAEPTRVEEPLSGGIPPLHYQLAAPTPVIFTFQFSRQELMHHELLEQSLKGAPKLRRTLSLSIVFLPLQTLGSY